MLYIIGGTSEANLTAAQLRRAGYQVKVSVATEWGARVSAASGHQADSGVKNAAELASRATELGASAIIDCSHPFAAVVSEEARSAAASAGLPYLRFCRPPLDLEGKKAVRADSWSQAALFLKKRGQRALLTVGVRNLEIFVRHGVDFMARVLPLTDSIAACNRLGIEPRDIIAAHPPFSVEFNRACIRQAKAGILVTKDSGAVGGLMEKEAASLAEGIDLLVVDRPADPHAIHEFESLVRNLDQALSS